MRLVPRCAVVSFTLALLLLSAPSTPAEEPPAPLSPRGEANLAAFARLLGVVRFFHPGDAVAATDWNAFAAGSVERVEAAPDEVALAALLAGRFRPLAPTVQVFPAGSPPPLPPALTRPSEGDPWRLTWRHYGVALGSGKLWSSDRVDDRGSLGFANLSQRVGAEALRGRSVRLSAWARAELAAGGKAELWLRVERGPGRPSELRRMGEVGIESREWTSYSLAAEVAPDAVGLTVGLVLTGGGHVWLDEVGLDVGKGAEVRLANPAFEQGELARQPPGWEFPYPSIRAGYRLALRRGEDCLRGGCAEVVADPLATPRFPLPSEVYEADLGSGLVARVPLSLWADGKGTLPHTAVPRLPAGPASPRAERLAGVALAWGVLQHFYPYFPETAGDWAGRLGPALAGAAVAGEPVAFRRVLRRLLAGLGDANASVNGPQPTVERGLPLAWEWIEGRLVVTAAGEGSAGLAAGDVVTGLDGRPVAEALAEAESLVSAPSPEARRLLAAEELRWGEPGKRRRLAIERAGAPAGTVEPAFSRSWEEGPVAPGPAVVELAPGVLYLDLRRLDDAGITELLPRLATARGLVLDARGLVEVGTILLSHLTDRERMSASWNLPVAMRPDHQEPQTLVTFWTIPPREPRLRAKVAFLIDRRAYAYAETLLTLVEEHRLGTLVGEPTAGNLGLVNRIPLPGGWRVQFTGSKVLKHDGSRLHGVGVLAQVRATRTLAGVLAGRDEVIEAGLAAVRP